MKLIDKAAVEAEINYITGNLNYEIPTDWNMGLRTGLQNILSFMNNLEIKNDIYVVTRCEEHSDYVEAAFFSKEKAENYCKPFNEDENEYARHITKVKIE